MRSTHPIEKARQRQIAKVEKRIQNLYNEMEFVEILAQFWPWQNMADKVDRLQVEIERLRSQTKSLNWVHAV